MKFNKNNIDKSLLNFIRVKINGVNDYYSRTLNGKTENGIPVFDGKKFIEKQKSNNTQLHGISKHNPNIQCLVGSEDSYSLEFLKSQGFKFEAQKEFVFPDDLDKIEPIEKKVIEVIEPNSTKGAIDLMAENTAIDFSSLIGTGKNGKVTKKDVENFIENV